MNEFSRLCPECQLEITYKNKRSQYEASKKNSKCKACGYKNAKHHSRSGINNPFYGKKHSKEYLDRQVQSNLGENNPMFGRSIYDIWVEKYGIDEANTKLATLKEKQSANNTGSKNKMYGRPTPEKAGNGWSGWYKKWFFRSLRELSYVINFLEKDNLEWKSCEGLIRISYQDWNGVERTYSPDFIVGNNIIEIKPAKLHKSATVLAKKEAAEKYCLEKNYIYNLIDCDILDILILKTYIANGLVVLTDKTKDKLIKYEETYST